MADDEDDLWAQVRICLIERPDEISLVLPHHCTAERMIVSVCKHS